MFTKLQVGHSRLCCSVDFVIDYCNIWILKIRKIKHLPCRYFNNAPGIILPILPLLLCLHQVKADGNAFVGLGPVV